jgi:hypothetical protein
MTTPTHLEMDFHKDMLAIYRSAKEECHYNATRFLQMVANDGGLKTAKKLLATNEPSDGFTELWKCGRLDLTVENLVLSHDYQGLFTIEEIKIAQERLNAYGYRKT